MSFLAETGNDQDGSTGEAAVIIIIGTILLTAAGIGLALLLQHLFNKLRQCFGSRCPQRESPPVMRVPRRGRTMRDFAPYDRLRSEKMSRREAKLRSRPRGNLNFTAVRMPSFMRETVV